MVAQEWLGHKLESSVYFEPDEQGLDLFAAYLRSISHEPVRLLVDLIEEEFRQIKIPLLRGSDRKAILERNYLKFFRTSKYKYAVSQSIEKNPRKEEKLLLFGLTNDLLLEPWLNIIDETRTPLSGIISLPLLSEDYVSHLETPNNAIILVSQQVPSNLRQSVFIDGKLVLSRLVPIASFYQGDYASDVIRDIESTQRYLISQRLVERADSVSIQVITNKRHVDKLTIKCAQEGFDDFQAHDINELLEKEKIEIEDQQDFSSGLFCYLATKKIAVNHYAQGKEKRYYRHHLTNLILKVISFAFIVTGVGVATTNAAKGWIYHSTVAETALIEQKYNSKFNRLSENSSGTKIPTSTMQNIVQTVDLIQKKYLNDPQELFSIISNDISLFSNVRVKKLEWFVSNRSDSGSAESVKWSDSSSRGLFEIAHVEGEFLNFDGNYRYVLSAVDDLEKAMNESGNYFSVEVIGRPLDIEPDRSLRGDLGKGKSRQRLTARLAFRLVREVKPDE